MQSMKGTGLENPAARLFSNPAGDYGSMVNERVGAGNWDSGQELGDTWASRNAFSYGRCGPEDFSVNLPIQLGARRIALATVGQSCSGQDLSFASGYHLWQMQPSRKAHTVLAVPA